MWMRGMTREGLPNVEKRGMLSVECLMLNVKNIQERAFEFACRIVRLTEHTYRRRSLSARAIARQLLDAGTSVAANLEEASSAQSKADSSPSAASLRKKHANRATGFGCSSRASSSIRSA
jgi:hypothetical protein